MWPPIFLPKIPSFKGEVPKLLCRWLRNSEKNLGESKEFENCQEVENLLDQKLNVPREQQKEEEEQHYNPTLDHAAARLVKKVGLTGRSRVY